MKTKFSEEHNWSRREEKNSDSYRGNPKRPPSGPQRSIEKMPTQLEASCTLGTVYWSITMWLLHRKWWLVFIINLTAFGMTHLWPRLSGFFRDSGGGKSHPELGWCYPVSWSSGCPERNGRESRLAASVHGVFLIENTVWLTALHSWCHDFLPWWVVSFLKPQTTNKSLFLKLLCHSKETANPYKGWSHLHPTGPVERLMIILLNLDGGTEAQWSHNE